jgi:hypothetical protein
MVNIAPLFLRCSINFSICSGAISNTLFAVKKVEENAGVKEIGREK